MVLIKGVKCGKPFLEFEDNLYVYNDDGNYTNEILKIYNKQNRYNTIEITNLIKIGIKIILEVRSVM